MEKYLEEWKVTDLAGLLDLEEELGWRSNNFNIEAFNYLTEKSKQEISSQLSHVAIYGRQLWFLTCSFEISEKIRAKVTKEGTGNKATFNRKKNELTLSTGNYTSEDIESIYHIQNGYCYYTGEKISLNPRTFQIDHIKPITAGGSSWPENLALCVKSANSQKKDMSKIRFFNRLEEKYGTEWVKQRKVICKHIDKERKKVDKNRKKAVESELLTKQEELRALHPLVSVEYFLTDGYYVCLIVNEIEVYFPAGYLRQKKSLNSLDYLNNLLNRLIGV